MRDESAKPNRDVDAAAAGAPRPAAHEGTREPLEGRAAPPGHASLAAGSLRFARDAVDLANGLPPLTVARLPRARSPGLGAALLRPMTSGAEWRCAAIEAGPELVDRLLVEVIEPLVEQVGRACAIDAWFFARHAAPRWHVRLHVHGEPSRLLAEALPVLHAHLVPFAEAGLVGAVRLGPDVREPATFGGPAAIEACEALACADSAAVLAVLAALGPGDDERRLVAAAVGLDRLLADLGLGVARRLAIVEGQQACLAATAPVSREATIEHVLDGLISRERTPPWAAPVLRAFGERGTMIAAVGQALRELEAARLLRGRFDDLVAGFLSQHVNRVVRAAGPAEEASLYARLAAAYRRCLGAGRATHATHPGGAGAGG